MNIKELNEEVRALINQVNEISQTTKQSLLDKRKAQMDLAAQKYAKALALNKSHTKAMSKVLIKGAADSLQVGHQYTVLDDIPYIQSLNDEKLAFDDEDEYNEYINELISAGAVVRGDTLYIPRGSIVKFIQITPYDTGIEFANGYRTVFIPEDEDFRLFSELK